MMENIAWRELVFAFHLAGAIASLDTSFHWAACLKPVFMALKRDALLIEIPQNTACRVKQVKY